MFARSVTALLAGAIVVGAFVFMMLPTAGATQIPFFAKARIADPPAVACEKQAWPIMDRHCLSWTAPR